MFGKSGVHDLGGGAGNVVAALYFIPWRVVICACESKQGNIRTLTTDYTLFTNTARERMMNTYVYINLVLFGFRISHCLVVFIMFRTN